MRKGKATQTEANRTKGGLDKAAPLPFTVISTPMCAGLDRSLESPPVRSPLASRVTEEILNVHSPLQRVEDPEQGVPNVSEIGVGEVTTSGGGGTRLGFGDSIPSSSTAASSSSSHTFHSHNLQRVADQFVGFFHKPNQKSPPKTYAHAVRAEATPAAMVFPAANCGVGRREGFGAGRAGRGAGRTHGRANVWQRVGCGRGGDDSMDAGEGHDDRSGQGGVGDRHHGVTGDGPNQGMEEGVYADANLDQEANLREVKETEDKSKWEHREEMRMDRRGEQSMEEHGERQATFNEQ